MVNDLDIDVESAEDEPDADPESGSTIGQDPASIELRFKRIETADGSMVEVTAIPSKEVRHLLIDDVPETLIARVMEDDIVMYPVNVNPTKEPLNNAPQIRDTTRLMLRSDPCN